MKKVDYDLLVTDNVNVTKYRKIIRCNGDATVHSLKQNLSQSIKCSFEIIFNDEILIEGMLLKDILSKHLQNCVILNPIKEPIPDQIKKHDFQVKSVARYKEQDEFIEQLIDQSQLKKILDNPNEFETKDDCKPQKCCQSCQVKKQILSNYEVSMESLLSENAELKHQISELEKQIRISIYKQKLQQQQQKHKK
ncbi:unnamed protein product (macronuclear) [Paramecium tetraurelia]|uniref:Uncharacterized protein n=1 Tax=Paramecium tetraurelia TaxID=5888 RepID=A0DWW8_PARTE|nr:uncharacterized protein GSPATT00021178001 [Paramecium tetraurelia]CAK87535.1 unnamed protein product [Paramecium tetraurelia]|eukprot:XP_001454932.1 hypothetical protein (macronuclear) [Paramecium tetraurelia strain d4-2]